MARPLRLLFAGAAYHITVRGNRREAIYEDVDDRLEFLRRLGRVCERHEWRVHAYCLMTNHYHLFVTTPHADLSRGMQYLNGVYTQYFNRRHQRIGHLLQGRFNAQLVDKEAYLLELSRYIVLNPVRAQMIDHPRDYRWSSYRATAGLAEPEAWLDVEPILSMLSEDRSRRVELYIDFVMNGIGKGVSTGARSEDLVMGSAAFMERLRENANVIDTSRQILKRHINRMRRPLEWYAEQYDRNMAIYQAFEDGCYSQGEIGRYFGLHFTTVSRVVSRMRKQAGR